MNELIPFVDLRAQHAPIRQEVHTVLDALLTKTDFILGEAVGRFEAEAARLAGALARRGPLALRYAKEAVLRALDLPLADGVRLEHDLYVLLQTTADRREGVRAFIERRSPRFEAC